jgi:hypothetical protein
MLYKRTLILVLLFAAGLSFAAKEKKEKPRPLRFPFALTPGMAPDAAKAVLTAKGLTVVREKQEDGERSVVYRLNGQIQQGFFIPTQAAVLFVKDKLSSVAFTMAGVPECGLAQTIFASALQFSRINYDPQEAPITEEPPVDTIDCGPHAAGSDWHLRRENKKTVLITEAAVSPAGYSITVSYFDRATMKPKASDGTDADLEKANKATQDNL